MMDDKTKGLKGVGGWLLLLILILIVLRPIWTAFRNVQKWEGLKQTAGEYATTAEYGSLHAVSWTGYAVSTIIGIAAGLMLWKRHRPSTVKIAIGAFWLTGPGIGLIIYLAGLYAVGEPAAFSDLKFLLVPVVSAALWTAYLLKSKRVRNTYGD
jgi:hypothetical protein